jgi:hypothetical protein
MDQTGGGTRGRGPPFNMVKRELVTFYNRKVWTKQAAAREAGDRRFWMVSALRARAKTAAQNRSTAGDANAREVLGWPNGCELARASLREDG